MRALHAAVLALLAALALASCGGRSGSGPALTFDPDSIPDAYLGPTAALTWPGTTRGFQITPAGDLYNGEWCVRIRPRAGGTAADAPRVIAFEDRWRPIAHWARRSGTVRWAFVAAHLAEPAALGDAARRPPRTVAWAPRDSGMLVSVEVRVTNQGAAPVEAELDFVLTPPDSFPLFAAFDAPDEPRELRWSSQVPEDLVEGWSAAPATGSMARAKFTIAPGASHVERIVVPSYPTPANALEAWARLPHERVVRNARKHWDDEVARATRFELGDPEIEHALDGALTFLLTCQERRGPKWVPIGGPLHYRDVWLRDGARLVQALSWMGRTTEARVLADGMLGFQWPHGPFLSQRGQLDGTGQALWAFGQALLRPSPADSLGRYLDASLAAWRWCEHQRQLGREAGWPYGAMLPYAEPRDNEVVRAQLVGNDAWAIAGYRALERMLRAAGRTAEAETIAASRARYVDDFTAALARTGSADIPPSWQGPGRDWGNLVVAYPCAVLSPRDPRCAAVARRVWASAGGAGLVTYGTPDSLHTYAGADLGTWALLAGERAAFDSVLDATLHWRNACGAAGEVFSRSGGYGRNPPPHPNAAAAIIALVRNSIVYDEDDTLRLTMGARERWWRNGRVRKASTRWGTLDVQFEHRGDEAEWRWTRVPVWTALTLPPGTGLTGSPPSPLQPGVTADQLLAPPGTTSARVRLAPRKPGS